MTFERLKTVMRDRRAQMGAAVVVLFAMLSIVFSLFALAPRTPLRDIAGVTTTPSATDAAHTPPAPRTTPPGTPGPTPDTAVSEAASAEIVTPSPKPNATPIPEPEPGLWRIGGYVVDETERPLEGVCVVIGPHGCRPFSPHTDERGYWYLDIAADKGTAFDFYFERPGHQTLWWHVVPTGHVEFNVVLRRG